MGQKVKTIIERLPTEILLRVFRGLTAEDILNIIKIPEFGLLKQRNDLMFDIVTGSKDSQINNHNILTGLDEMATNRFYLKELRRDKVLHNPGRYDVLVFCLSCEDVVKYRRKIVMLLKKYRGYVWFTETEEDKEYDYDYPKFYDKLEGTLAEFLKARINVFIDDIHAVALPRNSLVDPSFLSTRHVDEFYYDVHPYKDPWYFDPGDFTMSEYDSDGDKVMEKWPSITESKPPPHDSVSGEFHGLESLSLEISDLHTLEMFSGNIKNCPLKELSVDIVYDKITGADGELLLSDRVIYGGGFASTLCTLKLAHINMLENVNLPNLETLTVDFVGEGARFSNVSIPRVERMLIYLYNGDLELKNIYAGGPDHVIEEVEVSDSKHLLENMNAVFQPWKISGCDWIYHNIQRLMAEGADLFSQNDCKEKCFKKLDSLTMFMERVGGDLLLDEIHFPVLRNLYIRLIDSPSIKIPQFKAPVLQSLSVVIGEDGTMVDGIAANHPQLQFLHVAALSNEDTEYKIKLENVFTNWNNLQNLVTLRLERVEITPLDKLFIPNKLINLELWDCLGVVDNNEKDMGYHHELHLYPQTPGQRLTFRQLRVCTRSQADIYGLTIYTPDSTLFDEGLTEGYNEVEIISTSADALTVPNTPRDSVQHRDELTIWFA